MPRRVSLKAQRKPTRRRVLEVQSSALRHLRNEGRRVITAISSVAVYESDRYLLLCTLMNGRLPKPLDAIDVTWLRRCSPELEHRLTITSHGKSVFGLDWSDDNRAILRTFNTGRWMEDLLPQPDHREAYFRRLNGMD